MQQNAASLQKVLQDNHGNETEHIQEIDQLTASFSQTLKQLLAEIDTEVKSI